ncbi:sacsin-like [Gigantopelta aegis]|uniref:sacsin-like n=1 Tax=Gigantopelta aegis TaxID=1735272 RepID=UPI001B889C59|nr:sacsin-like [Gigantopelta aegis]
MSDLEEDSDKMGYSCMRLPNLIAQLKSILDQYSDNGQILKELVQNAEDARAREVHIIYDARNCNAQLSVSAKKKNNHLKALKGPGLCVYNNEQFSKADWQGIRSIQNSVKEEDRLTVGRFGLGFKSVFHLSDWPCVLSGKYILFINPHQSVNKVCLMKKLANLDATSQQACLDVFSGNFGFSPEVFTEGKFRGTMFWFPLRSTTSSLSDNIYDQSKIEDLFCTFQAEAKITLLFLKYVESIHLKKKDHLEEIHSDFSVIIAPSCLNDIRKSREIFLSKIQDVGTNLPEKSIQSDQQILIETESESSGTSTEEWIVTNFYKGGQVSEVFSKLLHDTDLSYSPYVGMATPLHHDANFHGHVFCFLPLPLDARNQTGLPVHINGFFALSQNRAYVKWLTTDQERTHSHLDKSVQWNKCLVKEVLPEVYVRLVLRQIAYSKSNGNSPQDVQHVYSSLPLPSVVRENWNLILQPFYEQLWQLPVLYTSNQQGKWICLQDSVLAVYRDDVPLKVQQTVTETYRRYNRNIVVLPSDLLATVKKYSAISPMYVECQTLCTLLRSNNTYKTFSRDDRLNLLTFILKFDSSCLHGLELLPVTDGSFVTLPAKVVFCPGKAHLFPRLERKVIADNIDQEVLRKLEHMAKNDLKPALSVQWVPVLLSKPTNYPEKLQLYSEYIHCTLGRPNEMTCIQHHPLVGSTCLVAADEVSHNIANMFGWNKSPILDKVANNILNAVEAMNEDEYHKVITIINSSFKHLYNSRPLPQNIQEKLKDARLVWIESESEFQKPNVLWIETSEHDVDLHPFRYCLPKHLRGLKELFVSLGSASHQTPDMLLDVLGEIKSKHDEGGISETDSKKDLALVLQILNEIKTNTNVDRKQILIPIHTIDKQLKLMTADKCTYCNAHWLKENPVDQDTGDDAIWYIHEDVAEATAIELGVCSLTNRVMEDTEVFGVDWSQKEPLTTRLKNLLKGYKDGFSVPKEIIQNADDAGANEVLFLYDERENNSARSFLIKETMDSLQGPALWAFNDAKFEDSDFKNITKLSGATKEENPRKIGKFGLGFNSIYNLTDVPSFISGNTVVIFDPHTSYLGKPGMKADLSTKKNQVMVKTIKGQFQPFEGVFGCQIGINSENGQCCPGTLFRFPLRTQEQASKSEISQLHYSTDEMNNLINVFFSGAGNLLLFLQSVKKVKLYHLPKDAVNASNPHLIMEVSRTDIEHSVHLNESVLSYMTNKWHEECNAESSQSVSIAEQINIKISVSQTAEELFNLESTSSETSWIIAWVSGQEESAIFAKSKKLKGLLPLAAVSVLYKKEEDCIRLLPLKECPSGFYTNGHLFCFLPLPITFPLQMHVNGTFALTNDRRQLCVKTEDDKLCLEAEWNEALWSDAVCLAIVKLIDEFRKMGMQDSEAAYSLWPKSMVKNISLQKAFYKLALTTEKQIFTYSGTVDIISECSFFGSFIKRDIVIDLPEEIIDGFISMGFYDEFKQKVLSTSAFFETIIFENINDAYWDQNNRNQFIMYALLQTNDQIKKLIQGIPCIPTRPVGTLKRPQDLVHPGGKASWLFSDADERFPEESAGDFSTYEALRALECLGMVKDNLNWADILERIQSIKVLNVTNSKQANERCLNVLNYFCHLTENNDSKDKLKNKKRYETCPEDIKEQIINENFIPVLKKPSGWLFPWKGDQHQSVLAKPLDLFYKKTVRLVGSMELILDQNLLEMFSNRDMLTWLGIKGKKQISASTVIHQLLQLCSSTLDYEKVKQWTVQRAFQDIYCFLNDACLDTPKDQNNPLQGESKSSEIARELEDKNVLWHDGRFLSPKQLVMELDYNLDPYLYQVDGMLKNHTAFLKILGVKHCASKHDLQNIFEMIAKKYKNSFVIGRDLTCIINAATLMADLINQSSSEETAEDAALLKLPDTEGCLHPISELCMDDYEMTEDSSLKILHPKISLSIAKMLGINTKRAQHLQHFMQEFTPFGQHEDLPRRIRNILSVYPLDSAFMKELLQNADDAKATEIMFIKDFRTHPSERVFGDTWSELQGPALCVYNDSYFTERDFTGIQKLGLGSKSEDPLKIGQYGVGFNCVYHLTDVPCLLTVGPGTKETLCILDPTLNFIEGANKFTPGARLEVKQNLRHEYQDVFSSFPTSQVQMIDQGTLFRLPLRTDRTSIADAVNPEKVVQLLDGFKEDMFESLLFLHNVKKISIASVAEDGTMEVEYMVQTEISKKYKRKQEGFVEHLETQAENVDDFSMDIGMTDLSPFEIQLELNIKDNENRHEKLACSVPELLSEAWANGDIRYLPQGGIAVNLELDSVPDTTTKHAFCMLPLPIETGLPVHVNGHFALDHETRRNLWIRKQDYKTAWNNQIATALLVPAYLSALQAMKAKHYAYCGGKKELCCDWYFCYLDDFFVAHNKSAPQSRKTGVNFAENLHLNKNQKRKISEKEKLICILKEIGIRLIEAPKRIFENLQHAGLQDQVLLATPENVVTFLKSYKQTNLPGKCSIGTLPDHVENTPLKELQLVKCLIEFCQKGDNFWDELEGLPLLLTHSGQLNAFTKQNPILVTDYTDLLHGSSNKLMEQSLINLFKETSTEIPQLRYLDIKIFAELLPETLDPSVFHLGRSVTWMNEPSESWIRRLWDFLSKSVIAKGTEHKKVDSAISEEAEMLTSEEVDGELPEQSRCEMTNKRLVTELLQDWSLLPVTWSCDSTESTAGSNLVTKKYLFPIKDAMKVLHCVTVTTPTLNTALDSIVVPKLDCSVFGQSDGASHLAISLVASPLNPKELLDLLVLYQYKEEFCRRFGPTFLKYFSDSVKTFEAGFKADHCRLRIRKLRFFETLNHSCTSLAKCQEVVLIEKKSSVPENGTDAWSSESNVTLLKEKDGMSKLYSFLVMKLVGSFELYSSYFLPYFDLFPREAKLEHLKYLKFPLLAKRLKFDDDQKVLIEKLKNVKFIETEDGTLHRANRFYSKKEVVFRVMCDKSDFPPHQFDGEEWHDFLVLAGMINEVSEDKFVEYANKVEQKGWAGITPDVAKMSDVLIRHILTVPRERKMALYSRIKTIRFILPLDISKHHDGKNMLSIVPQFHCGNKLIAFEGSACHYSVYQIWSTYPILCESASNALEFFYMSIYKMRVHHTPPKERVIKHMQNICSYMQERDGSCLQDEMRRFVKKIMCLLYEYLHKTKLSDFDVEELSTYATVYLPDEGLSVKAQDVVTEPERSEVIDLYLYKAPSVYGKFFHLFHRLGASQLVTANHYALILEKIHEDTKGRKLKTIQRNILKKLVKPLFRCLQTDEKKDLHVKHLYLPNTDYALTDSSALVMSDNKYFMERVSSLKLLFMLDSKDMGIETFDPVKAIKSLPQKYQPKLLTEMVVEKISLKRNEVLSEKFTSIFKCDFFISGLIRLISHAKKQKDANFTESAAKEIEEKLFTLEIFEVEELKTAMFIQNSMITASEVSVPCFTETRNYVQGKCMYITTDAADNVDGNVDELAFAVNLITGDQLGTLVLYLKKIMLCKPEDIPCFLDRHGIKVYTYNV